MRNRCGFALVAALTLAAGGAGAAEIEHGAGEAATTVAAAEPAAAVPPVQSPIARPIPGNRLVHEAHRGHLCIGGVLCEHFCADQKNACTPVRTLFIRLDKPARIDTIQLSAHDNVGATRRSRLIVKVNGREVASTLVYRLGSTLSLDVNAAGELITIESEHQYNGFLLGGEEAVVWDVFVFGDDRS